MESGFLRLQESEKASKVQGGQCRSGVHLKAVHPHISAVAINHDRRFCNQRAGILL